MLRITEIKLPVENAPSLTHEMDTIQVALLKRLHITATDLIGFSIFKRGVDARKSNNILYVYSLDCEVKNEATTVIYHLRVKHRPDTLTVLETSVLKI